MYPMIKKRVLPARRTEQGGGGGGDDCDGAMVS
jgi:hypothetical protein